jgi:hypothetical protein
MAMTWFGTVSAWGAVAVGLVFVALAAMSFSWESLAVPVLNGICAMLLLVAAFRILRKKSGGLRLLCGAWALVAGLSIERLLSLFRRVAFLGSSSCGNRRNRADGPCAHGAAQGDEIIIHNDPRAECEQELMTIRSLCGRAIRRLPYAGSQVSRGGQ